MSNRKSKKVDTKQYAVEGLQDCFHVALYRGKNRVLSTASNGDTRVLKVSPCGTVNARSVDTNGNTLAGVWLLSDLIEVALNGAVLPESKPYEWYNDELDAMGYVLMDHTDIRKLPVGVFDNGTTTNTIRVQEVKLTFRGKEYTPSRLFYTLFESIDGDHIMERYRVSREEECDNMGQPIDNRTFSKWTTKQVSLTKKIVLL